VNLYGFVDNDTIGSWDYRGLWKRKNTFRYKPKSGGGSYKGRVCAAEGDTFEELAELLTGSRANAHLIGKGKPKKGEVFDLDAIMLQMDKDLRKSVIDLAKKSSDNFGSDRKFHPEDNKAMFKWKAGAISKMYKKGGFGGGLGVFLGL